MSRIRCTSRSRLRRRITGCIFAHAKVLRALEADPLEQHDLPITWFDVLTASGRRLISGCGCTSSSAHPSSLGAA